MSPSPRNARPRREPCRFGVYCVDHEFVHGAEAEELRSKLERLVGPGPHEDDSLADCISRLLDEVDARDSLAWLEFKKAEEAAEAGRPSRSNRNRRPVTATKRGRQR